MLFPAVLAFLAVKMITLAVNIARFPVLAVTGAPGTGPPSPGPPSPGGQAQQVARTVSLLVPVRDEAAALPRFLPAMLRQSGYTELLILDDESSDGSAAIAASLIAGDPRARIIAGTRAPAGWAGKTWACQQLASASASSTAAAGSILLYCDADVLLAAGTVTAVLAEMDRQHAEVFSVFPRQQTGSLAERLTTPLIDDVLLCFLPFPLLSVPVPAAATANGSLLGFTRQAYEQLGGFAAVRAELVEDVAIARAARRRGLRLGLALGGGLASTRMYAGYREVIRGLGRGLVPALGGSRARLAAAAAWHLAVYTWPLWRARTDRRWLVPLGLGILERLIVALKADPRSAWQAALTPLCPVAFLPVAGQAMRRQQRWKGRSYS